ncbi:PspC domain-containing protein [Mobilicoccus massiliensis]|uniref:PspC domain-containing protein n=1 Tax=Mobilicoccus massiliensis TaxID=1522310 RepID=UPI00058CE098|nr:PspC domain-containing protein [Mobilicoccus massiliensis]
MNSNGPLDRLVERCRETGVRRAQDRRWVAGVCIGLAHRWNVDPVLIRVGFILLTIFGGIGITVYLLCWLLLPGADGSVALDRALRAGDGAAITLFIFTVVVTIGTLTPDDNGPPSGLLGLVLLGLVVWWLVHSGRFSAGTATPASAQAAHDAAGTTAPTATTATPSTASTALAPTTSAPSRPARASPAAPGPTTRTSPGRTRRGRHDGTHRHNRHPLHCLDRPGTDHLRTVRPSRGLPRSHRLDDRHRLGACHRRGIAFCLGGSRRCGRRRRPGTRRAAPGRSDRTHPLPDPGRPPVTVGSACGDPTGGGLHVPRLPAGRGVRSTRSTRSTP